MIAPGVRPVQRADIQSFGWQGLVSTHTEEASRLVLHVPPALTRRRLYWGLALGPTISGTGTATPLEYSGRLRIQATLQGETTLDWEGDFSEYSTGQTLALGRRRGNMLPSWRWTLLRIMDQQLLFSNMPDPAGNLTAAFYFDGTVKYVARIEMAPVELPLDADTVTFSLPRLTTVPTAHQAAVAAAVISTL